MVPQKPPVHRNAAAGATQGGAFRDGSGVCRCVQLSPRYNPSRTTSVRLPMHKSSGGTMSRCVSWAVLACSLLAAPLLPAQSQRAGPEAIIDRALEALGGAEQLRKWKAYTWK